MFLYIPRPKGRVTTLMMKKLILLLLILLKISLYGQVKSPDNGDGTYINPIICVICPVY